MTTNEHLAAHQTAVAEGARFACANCDTNLKVRKRPATDRIVACPRCGRPVTIPGLRTTAVDGSGSRVGPGPVRMDQGGSKSAPNDAPDAANVVPGSGRNQQASSSQLHKLRVLAQWLKHEALLVFVATRDHLKRVVGLATTAKDSLQLKNARKTSYIELGVQLHHLGVGDQTLLCKLDQLKTEFEHAKHADPKTPANTDEHMLRRDELAFQLASTFLVNQSAMLEPARTEIEAARAADQDITRNVDAMNARKRNLLDSDVATNLRAGFGFVCIAMVASIAIGRFGSLLYPQSDRAVTVASYQASRESASDTSTSWERVRAERAQAQSLKRSRMQKAIAEGDLLRKQGQLADALTAYRSAFKVDPESAVSYNGQGMVSMLLHQWTDARGFFDKAIRKDRKFTSSYVNRARCSLVLGDSRKALNDLDDAIQLDPSRAYFYSLRAQANRELGNRSLAMRDCATAMRLDNRLAAPYFNRGCLLAENPESLNDAVSDLTDAISRDPSHAMAHLVRGQIRQKQGDLRNATIDYGAAIKTDGKLTAAFSSRAYAHALLGNHSQAVRDFTEVLRLTDPGKESLKIYLARGESYNAAGAHAKALDDFDRVLEAQPNDLLALKNRLKTHEALGDEQRAIGDRNRIASLTKKSSRQSLFSDVQLPSGFHGGYSDPNLSNYYSKRADEQARYQANREMRRYRSQLAGKLGALGVTEW